MKDLNKTIHKESWVLVNRPILIKKGTLLRCKRGYDIPHEYRKEITFRFNEVVSPELVEQYKTESRLLALAIKLLNKRKSLDEKKITIETLKEYLKK
jgi:hypothetical protein